MSACSSLGSSHSYRQWLADPSRLHKRRRRSAISNHSSELAGRPSRASSSKKDASRTASPAASLNPSISASAAARASRHATCCGASGSVGSLPARRARARRRRPALVSAHTGKPLRRARLSAPPAASSSSRARTSRARFVRRRIPRCSSAAHTGTPAGCARFRWRSARSTPASTNTSAITSSGVLLVIGSSSRIGGPGRQPRQARPAHPTPGYAAPCAGSLNLSVPCPRPVTRRGGTIFCFALGRYCSARTTRAATGRNGSPPASQTRTAHSDALGPPRATQRPHRQQLSRSRPGAPAHPPTTHPDTPSPTTTRAPQTPPRR